MAVKDFVVKSGLQVRSNVVIGTYSNNVTPLSNGMLVSGAVGIGTSTLAGTTKFEVQGGNVKLGTNGYGLVFPDGTYQTTAAASTSPGGTSGAVQYNTGSGFGGDATYFYYNSSLHRLAIGASDTSAATVNIVGSAPSFFNTANSGAPEIIVGATQSGGITLGQDSTATYGYLKLTNTGNPLIAWNSSGVGINNITAPVNALDVAGGVVIGGGITYAGSATAPTNGMYVQGAVGIGTTVIGTNNKLAAWGGNLKLGGTGFGVVFNDGSFQTTAFNSTSAVTSFSAGTTGLTPNTGTTGAVTLAGTLNLTSGGTNASLTASNGGIVYSTATAMAILAGTATAGQHLQSGASGAPSWTTATFPSTAGTAGTILRSNGTNWVNSSVTYVDTGTSGGIPYYSSTSAISSSALLAANAIMVGGGAGTAPSTITTGTGVVTALGVNTGSAGAFVVNGGALGIPSSGNLINATSLPLTTGVTGVLPIANGGTNGTATPTAGAVPYGNGTAYAFSAAGTSGNILLSGGTGAPTWGYSYTSSNLPNSVVSRDASGNFSAGTITAATGLTISTGGANITGNVSITGILSISGNVNTINSNVLIVNDPIIYIGESNPANVFDMGMVASYTTDRYRHTGFARNQSDGVWTIFDNLITEPTQTINWSQANLGYGSFKVGNVNVAATTASTSTTSGALIVAGGAGIGGNIYGGANVVISTSGKGVVFSDGSFQTTAFSSTSAVTSFSAGTTGLTPNTGTTGAVTLGGTLGLSNGGTNASLTASNGGIVYSGSSALAVLSASATSGNVLLSGGAGAPTWGYSYTTANVPNSIVARDATGNVTAQGFSGTHYGTWSGNTISVASGGTGLTSGTSGGVLYYSASGTLASSGALAASSIVVGGGAGVAPSTITTGTGVVTALGVNTGSAGAFVVNGGALGIPSSGNLISCTSLPLSTGVTGTLPLANGGTNASLTASNGGIVYSGASAFAVLSASATSGNVLLSGGAGAPTWGYSYSTSAIGNSLVSRDVSGNIAAALGTFSSLLSTGQVNVAVATASTSTTTGAIITSGGVGVAGNLNVGGVTLNTGNVGIGTSAVTGITAGNVLAVFGNAQFSSNVFASGFTGTHFGAWNGTTIGVAYGGTGLTSGTSGGVLYYSASGTLASSGALAASSIVVGGGAGVAPSTITTGTGVVTALGVNTGTAGAFVVNGGALGIPSSGNLISCTSLPLTTGVTGVLPIANGGTNSTATPTAGGVGYGTGTAHAYTTASATVGNVLISNAGSAPSWGPNYSSTNGAGNIVVRDASGNFSAANVTVTGVTFGQTVNYTISTTTASAAQATLDSFPTATYRAAEYQISITNGTNYEIVKVTVIHDGTNAYTVEYDNVFTSATLATYDASVSAGNCNLLVTPANATSTTYKIARTLWVV